MSEKDTRNVIDNSNVVLIDNQVVNGWAIEHLWCDHIFGIDPIALNLNWVFVGQL